MKDLLKKQSKKPPPKNGIIPTKLYAQNVDVDKENYERLNNLDGDLVSIVARDLWKVKPDKAPPFASFKTPLETIIPEVIHLKIGAQVMLLRNRSPQIPNGAPSSSSHALVNGSRGKVVDFSESLVRPGIDLNLC